MSTIVCERKYECSTLDWDCRHDFFYLFLRKIPCSLVLEAKNHMKIYFPVKYQVLFDLRFPLNSEHCFGALKRTFTGKYFDKISKIEFSLWKTCQISLLAFSFRQKNNFMFLQTISDIIFGTIPHFCVKSTNHKYSKISFLHKDKSTLVVYPCVLDLGILGFRG